jgi:proteasome beta subunit
MYLVDSAGAQITDVVLSIGSGSSLTYGVLDRIKKMESPTIEEMIKVVTRAIRGAVNRDIGSGGAIDLYTITAEDGIKRLNEEEIERLSGNEL